MSEILAHQQQLFNEDNLIKHFSVKHRVVLMRKNQSHRKSNNMKFVKKNELNRCNISF